VTDSQNRLVLSALEADVLVAIEHVGWYAYLWFPIVQRDVLNFGSNDPDDEVQAAFASLIRKGALVLTQDSPGGVPQWSPAIGALEIARETLSLGRDLRNRGQ
jgi:hypothetical protein